MGDIQGGTSFVDGQTVNAAVLNNITAGAVIQPAFITGKPARTVLTNLDAFIYYSTFLGSLAQITTANLRNYLFASYYASVGIGDNNATLFNGNSLVVNPLTAQRTLTLPSASGGSFVTIIDEIQGVNSVNNYIIQRAGSDLIYPGGLTSITFSKTGGSISLVSDGASKWVVQDPASSVASPTVNASTSPVSGGYASDTYLAGSAVTIPAPGLWTVSSVYTCSFDMTKTAASIAAPVIKVRLGTTGTISDPAIYTFTFGAGTAAADVGEFRVGVTFNNVGPLAIVAGGARLDHSLSSGGLVQGGSGGFQLVAPGQSSTFNSTTATTLGISFNGGLVFSGTNTYVNARYEQP